jgi:hypothetical protein
VENPFKSNFPAKEGYDYLGRATLILLLAVVPHLVMAQSDSILNQVHYLNLLYDGAPTNAPETFLVQAASVSLFSGSVSSLTNFPPTLTGAPAPTDHQLCLTQSAIGQLAGGVPPASSLLGVAILAPANGFVSIAPANILLNALAWQLETNDYVQKVEFYATGASFGTNILVAGATNSLPGTSSFSATWSNVATGAFVLTAVATDNLGDSVTSAPMSLTVTVPAQELPIFTLSTNSYTVLESNGSVTVTVLKNANSLAGLVNFATMDGTAIAVSQGAGNYQAVQGSLSFDANQYSQTISIPIVDNPVYEGNTAFSFVLSPAGANDGTVGTPDIATITIIDVNPPSTNGSVLQSPFPSQLPEHDGSLQVIILTNNGAQGQWRLTWDTTWHNSGDIIGGLCVSNYPVTFSPVGGYLPPPDTTYEVIAGITTVETVQYEATGTASYGSFSVTISPPNVAGAAWRFQGDTNWYPSGYVLSNQVSGDHIVEFQPVVNWVTPTPERVIVEANEEESVSAFYEGAEQSNPNTTQPTSVPFDQATGGESGLPYYFCNGQLLTDAGDGSGCLVQPRVVLTAGHMVFNDQTLTYVANAYWFFEEYAGTTPYEYNPPGQTPAGWYVLSGYAEARTNDLASGDEPGTESPASHYEDVAALYFLSDAGRGGSSGYLVSGSNNTAWPYAGQLETLVGYPVDGLGQEVVTPGVMYATTPRYCSFIQETNSVFSTEDLIGYPGMSGGPLCVQSNGIYYPAAVYLGGTQNAIVRAIDGDVANLINLANLTAYTGANHSGGGVIDVASGPGLGNNPGVLEITIAPPAAFLAGAAWKLTTQSNADYSTQNPSALALISSNSVQLQFRPIPGWNVPTNQSLLVAQGEVVSLTAYYTLAQPLIQTATRSGASFTFSWSAPTNQMYEVQTATNLNQTVWTVITNGSTGANSAMTISEPIATNSQRFYRVVLLP